MSNAKYLIVEPLATGGAVHEFSRAQALRLIWKHTHRDYRGTQGGVKTVLQNRVGHGTCLVPLDALTDTEIEDKLQYAYGAEQRAKDAKLLKAVQS